MKAECIRQTDLPGTSRLFADFLYHFPALDRFFRYPPSEFESFRKAAAQIAYPAERRAAVVEALRKNNAGSPLLDKLALPETLAVVTGQQVGLYGGPCYTVYKALTAVHLARQLDERGIPAVPVFWLATEDHDFEEIDHAWTFDGEHHPVALKSTGAGLASQPVGGIEITSLPDAELRAALESLPFGNDVLAMVARAYRPGKTYAQAFIELVREVLGGYQLLVLDPMEPGIRAAAVPFLKDALAAAPQLSEQVKARSAELTAAGYHAQVLFEGADASFFFVLEDGRRVPLRKQAVTDFSRLSPNALLRPVMQDYLLPTVALIGGPAEIAYLAQSAPLYDGLLGRRPVAIARNGFTLLEPRAAKLLDRYRFHLPELLVNEDAFAQTAAARLVPDSVRQSFASAQSKVTGALASLEASLKTFDPTIAAALDKSRAKIEYQLGKAERKVARETQRRTERASEDAAYLTHYIYPHRHLQERFYSILPFLATHGPGLIGEIYANIHVDCPDHHVLPVG